MRKKVLLLSISLISIIWFANPNKAQATETITTDIGTTTPNSPQSWIKDACVYESFVASTSFDKVTKIGFIIYGNGGQGKVRVGISTSTSATCVAGVYTEATSSGWLSNNYVDQFVETTGSTTGVTVFDVPDTTVVAGTTYYARACALSTAVPRIISYATNVAPNTYHNVNSTGDCNAITNKDLKLTVWQDSTATTCTSWTYSAWSECLASSTQTRTISSSSPVGCTGGSPVLEQACVYVPAGLNVINIDNMTTPIMTVVVQFISLLLAQVWPFIFIAGLVAGFAFSFNRFLHKIINKNE